MPLWKLLIQMRNSAPGYATSTADNPFAGRNAVPPGNAGNEWSGSIGASGEAGDAAHENPISADDDALTGSPYDGNYATGDDAYTGNARNDATWTAYENDSENNNVTLTALGNETGSTSTYGANSPGNNNYYAVGNKAG